MRCVRIENRIICDDESDNHVIAQRGESQKLRSERVAQSIDFCLPSNQSNGNEQRKPNPVSVQTISPKKLHAVFALPPSPARSLLVFSFVRCNEPHYRTYVVTTTTATTMTATT